MALPNPRADKIMAEGGMEAREPQPLVEDQEEIIDVTPEVPKLSVEEMNALLKKHEQTINQTYPFKAGQIVELNDMALEMDMDFPLKPGQKAIVYKFGKEAVNISQNFFRDIIVHYVTEDNWLDTAAMSAKFLKKVGQVPFVK